MFHISVSVLLPIAPSRLADLQPMNVSEGILFVQGLDDVSLFLSGGALDGGFGFCLRLSFLFEVNLMKRTSSISPVFDFHFCVSFMVGAGFDLLEGDNAEASPPMRAAHVCEDHLKL